MRDRFVDPEVTRDLATVQCVSPTGGFLLRPCGRRRLDRRRAEPDGRGGPDRMDRRGQPQPGHDEQRRTAGIASGSKGGGGGAGFQPTSPDLWHENAERVSHGAGALP
jgi:hypothetical protein